MLFVCAFSNLKITISSIETGICCCTTHFVIYTPSTSIVSLKTLAAAKKEIKYTVSYKHYVQALNSCLFTMYIYTEDYHITNGLKY